MLHRNLKKIIILVITCMVASYIVGPSVFAAEPHEDPVTAPEVFSGISLLRYYSASLDFVLQMNPAEVEVKLGKMPFANIPQNLEDATGRFASSSINISYLIVEIDEDLSMLRVLRKQFRLDETIELAVQASASLSQAHSELEQIEQATKIIGAQLKVSSAPEESDLRQSYDEVLDRIDRIRELLALYQEFLKDTNIEEFLKDTGITLEIQPMTAFVGDNIRFKGTLTYRRIPLGERKLDILLNNSRYLTVKTDAYGHYEGILQVPYWYIPELELQALYYPRDKDIGLYLAAMSPVVKLKVLFYETGLEVTLEDKAYPGLETTVAGRFDYGQNLPPRERKVEIYLDDVYVTELKTGEEFLQEIKLSPELDVGKHIITVSAVAAERYSSVVTSAILDVTKEPLILDINIPAVAMIPGGIGLRGKLYSEVGPVSGAQIRMGLGKSQVELVSSEDGTFDTEIKMGIGFGLIGSQDLEIQVIPQEPWRASLTTTRNMVVMNMINFGGILILLAFLAIFLPGRLRGRLRMHLRRRTRPAIAIPQPEPAPVYSETVLVPALTEENGKTDGEPRNRIFYWYCLALRLVQRMSRALLRPQQTLREFARESSQGLGPAAKYFIELTGIVEKLIYSQYRPTEGDVEKSKQLSHTIKEEFKG